MSEPNSEHDFRVHKLIISLASPAFKDMFAFPQPPDPNSAEVPDISIVDVPDSKSLGRNPTIHLSGRRTSKDSRPIDLVRFVIGSG